MPRLDDWPKDAIAWGDINSSDDSYTVRVHYLPSRNIIMISPDPMYAVPLIDLNKDPENEVAKKLLALLAKRVINQTNEKT
jgi:hypothetical protein